MILRIHGDNYISITEGELNSKTPKLRGQTVALQLTLVDFVTLCSFSELHWTTDAIMPSGQILYSKIDNESDMKVVQGLLEKYNVVSEKPETYISNCSGKSRLVRLEGEIIKIVLRKGTKSKNKNSFDSVCITDVDSNKFFSDCKTTSRHHVTGSFQIEKEYDPDLYAKWDEFMITKFEERA